MNGNKNWTKVTLIVVLALASLSSIAMSAPYRERLDYLPAPPVPERDAGASRVAGRIAGLRRGAAGRAGIRAPSSPGQQREAH